MLTFFYNILFPIIFLFFVPAMLYKLIRRPGIKRTFAERFGIFSRQKRNTLLKMQSCVWVHAVSVGEAVVAIAMIKEWQKQSPEKKFVISTTTTTGQALAAKQAPDGVQVIFSPIDFNFIVREFYRVLRPKMLVIFETELWPNLIKMAKQYNTKLALVNGRMSDNSAKGYKRWSFFFKRLLVKFDLIAVQTKQDFERYLAVAANAKLKITGNMKFDQQISTPIESISLQQYFGNNYGTVILAASTHPGEENLIIDAFNTLFENDKNLRLVIVPRHAERGSEIAKLIENKKLSYCRRSHNTPPQKSVTCLLADTTGEMLQLMSAADIVIMGKSLAGQNEGHNIIEPAILGKPIVTGAILKNFRQVLEIFKNQEALITIDCDSQLFIQLKKLCQDKVQREALGQKAKQAVVAQRGATERTIKELEALL